ncbi:MAG: DUF1549 domain-containing protein, partial [Planctomycetaceae bacterium]|nr:DUF1549 domain-containing protein [Planctomycetaceae bacterium]
MKSFGLSLTALLLAGSCLADDAVMPSVAERFSDPAQTESVPDFQRHIVPLMGKLGCNGRACHGSFQGRGGFRLSLFGYDFKADHDELFGRLDPETPSQSLILQKPLMEDPHEGGQRLKHNSWEHNLLLAWIKDQAPGRPENAAKLTVLEVTPAEIRFSKDSDSVQLKAVAVWSDGTREDVTTLCRFQSNDDQVADITEDGFVKAGTSGDTHVVAFYDSAVVPVPVIRPVSDKTGDRYPKTPTPTEVDRLVIDKLAKLGVVQSDVCTDEEFLRRVSLDVTGALPGVREIQEFVADQSSDKRSRKIDELLERPGYVAWWTTRLCDFTGNSDEQLNNVTPIRSEASKQWYDWIYKRVATNVHYDDIVEGMVMAVSRDPGESYQDYCKNISELYHRDSKSDFGDREFMPHYWSRRNFQTTEDRVIGFAYTFLGLRIQCAQCHKHPFDQWTQEDFKGFEKFFTGTVGRNQAPRPEDRDEYNRMLKAIEGTSDLKGNQLRNELGKKLREGQIVPFGEVYTQAPPKIEVVERKGKKEKVRKGNSRTATEGRLLGQETMDLTQYEDIRQPLMAWMRSPDNPLFARAFVNRVWASYFNVGIVNPSDDLNLANPPSNAPLLDYLAQQFIAHDFDMKWLHRTILNSRTYQLSWIPNETNQHDERNFARAVPRRLPAETAWDILTQAVSNDDTFVALTTDIEDRAVAIPGSGGRNQNRNADYALTIFGRSTRESNCDCDRSEEPSLLQTIFLRNDGQVLSMIDQKDGWLAQVASENGLKFQSKSPAGEDRAAKAKADQLKKTYQSKLAEQENALRKARKKGEDPKRIARLEAQLEASRERWKSYLNPEAGAANEAATKTATLDLPKI